MVKNKKEVNPEGNINDENDVRLGIYEVGYLMLPTIPEESLGEEVTLFKDSISDKGATFISDEYPKLIDLAYEMSRSVNNKRQKFSYGYFGWVKFECTADMAKAIKESLDNNEKIIRFLLIKTVRENTMSPKRSYKQDGSRRRSQKVKEETPEEPINEETIDQEIDALVV